MTKTTKSTERLLERVGISVGADNKLELDEDAIKKADISTLKSVFTGYNSFASKVYDKAQSMTNAAARAGGTYTSTAIIQMFCHRFFRRISIKKSDNLRHKNVYS